MKILTTFLILTILSPFLQAAMLSGYKLNPADKRCDGFPLLPIDTIKGACAGLVLSDKSLSSKGKKLRYPRHIMAINGTDDFFLTDMVTWNSFNSGRLWRLNKENNGKYSMKIIFDDLNLPLAIKYGPDGMVYLGEQDKIIRFDENDPKDTRETVFDKLPIKTNTNGHLHSLSQFVFIDGENILVNVGALDDRCIKNKGKICQAGEGRDHNAALWLLSQDLRTGVWKSKPYAHGLRNSIALVRHHSGAIYQAENGHEISNKEENKHGPFEEFNEVFEGKHYGWPYCYNFYASTPEWNNFRGFSCNDQNENYQAPIALIPPHASPLDMFYYGGDLFPTLKGKLLMSWHGWKAAGQRVVAYEVDEQGRIRTETTRPWYYRLNNDQGQQKARVKGGEPRIAPYTEVLTNWGEIEGVRPKGRPIGLAEARDGSIWVVDDKSKSIIRIAKYSGKKEKAKRESRDNYFRFLVNSTKENKNAREKYRQVDSIITNRCLGCHSDFSERAIPGISSEYEKFVYLLEQSWINTKSPEDSLFYLRSGGLKGTTAMPPGTNGLNKTEMQQILSFIKTVPGSKLVRLKALRANLRNADVFKIRRKTQLKTLPVCGVISNEKQNINLRVVGTIKGKTHTWAKVILEDAQYSSTNQCVNSKDGVFYIAKSLLGN